MSTEPQIWPFDSPPNVVCFTVRSIVDGVRPVLMASRDADDGAWYFSGLLGLATPRLASNGRHRVQGLQLLRLDVPGPAQPSGRAILNS